MTSKKTYKDSTRRDPKIIGQKIRVAREAREMTQAQLAEKVGTSQQTIEKIELGKVQRSSFIHPIFDVLGLRGAPIAGYNPAPRADEYQLDGESLRTRREFLGLEASEVAAITNLTVEDVEKTENSLFPIHADHLERAIEVDRILSRLESEEPLGEPFVPFNYHLSALPSFNARVAYFTMNPDKGISFRGYIASPAHMPKGFIAGAFCIETAPWVSGIAAGGDRIYCRLDVNLWRWKQPLMVLAAKAGQAPADLDQIIVGDLIQIDRTDCRLTGLNREEIVLPLREWDCHVILDAAWSNDTFQKMRQL